MISFRAVDSIDKERILLQDLVKDLGAILTEEYWNSKCYKDLHDLLLELKDEPLMDLGCFDVLTPGMVDSLVDIRKSYKEALILLIADATVSPVDYLKPGIRADSLILRPFSIEQLKLSLSVLINSYLENIEESGESLVVETRDERTAIPYNSIFYFEAKDKKVYARTLNDEFGFYESIESLMDRLPQDFMRCHRSFVINKNKLLDVKLSQNEIELKEGFYIPLSRSYKTDFKGFKRQASYE